MERIYYGIHETAFGVCVIGIMDKSVCRLSFLERTSEKAARDRILDVWPKATLIRDEKKTGVLIKNIFSKKREAKPALMIVKGTPFQKKVWKVLERIPSGKTLTYREVAEQVGSSKAVRAVGSACGKNPIAYLIPCHRVLASNGKLGGYRWGIERKQEMLLAEAR